MSIRFHFGRAQQIAALILLFFFAEALIVIGRTPLADSDYRYALCGREIWEHSAPVAGYFTTCGNMQGDGSLAYRAAGLPFTLYIQGLKANDYLAAKRAGQKYDAEPISGSVYDLRHQIVGTRYLLRVPFALAAVLLGAGLWWVSRRLFGNIGGALALGLYTVSPLVLRYATSPNNEILATWGMFATVYTAIGIAHAMYGPSRKWRPRIVLFTVALGLTACAHILAAIFAVVASAVFMFWVAERRRTVVLPLLVGSGMGALLLVWASYNFRLSLLAYVFSAGAARFMLSLQPVKALFTSPLQLAAVTAAAIALVLFFVMKRSRYFGNTVPLLVTLVLLPIETTQITTIPTLWAYPFLLTFTAGVFADATETQQRKLFLAVVITTLLAQLILCATWIISAGK